MRKNLLYLLPILFAVVTDSSSCSKSGTDTDISAEAVVVGYLNAGKPISIKIYEQKALDDTASYGPALSGLTPGITDGSKSINLTETATGTYTYADSTYLTPGKTYTLNFTYNGKPVTASTIMPTKPTGYTSSATTLQLPLATTQNNTIALIFKWKNPDSLYHVLVFKNDETSPYNVHLQNNSPVNFTFNVNKAEAYNVYYRSLNYLGVYRAILYRVNKEYIDLLNNTTTTTSKNLTNPPTNVVGGLGIFTAMQSDTIKLTFY
ncbi:hypothetical protein BEL04_18855 [Mucilaginibacter sp. PPCGB 2223]|uniref:DUF4249 family protein n=1 Tax=Mucilaginibacter sp. PPCGB 2223 TaxID=1886027 RepID=UPI0008259962|nr:DUF4249 family protein [Mucilaginibacter sp. PPCGB 2223]OCX50792.1 hypothetical protein BEL04_18855 [Mucilaginibacter sp. PPCGB 2223]